ncbi:MAG: hypothetical protein QOG46_548 [Pseudonocardiales bacterium]|jgi:hypothetical protein|nr:hypothetical protein [Pseudonocardiales bacterium]
MYMYMHVRGPVRSRTALPSAAHSSTIRVSHGLRTPWTGLLLSADMTTPTVITAPTVTTRLTVSSDPYATNRRQRQRCDGALGHINALAEDGEWHCHLPHGHDGVCLALDGTTW